MIVRLILSLLLAAFAMPAGAGAGAAAPCHEAAVATTHHAMPMDHRVPDDRMAATHVCIGCIPPSDWLSPRVTARAPLRGPEPVSRAVRLALGHTGPPALPPPRAG